MLAFPKPTKKTKTKKKTQRIGLYKRKADQAFSLFIRTPNHCQLKGLDNINCNGNLQCMHIIGRANMRLRFDPQNALCGCAGHHIYYTNHPWEWVQLIMKKFPDRYKYLEANRNTILKHNIDSYKDIIQQFS